MASEIKKKDWENHFLKEIANLGQPIVPGEASLANYRRLIKKHVSGKKALLFGATWQLRDLLAELGFEVTVVDISMDAMDMHSELCRVEDRKEKLVQADWLEFDIGRYDLILGDDCNIQLKEEDYERFFSNVASLLNDNGVSIQVIEGAFLDVRSGIEDVVEFLKSNKEPSHFDIAFYYLSYALNVNGHKFRNLAQIEHDLKPFVDSDVIDKETYEAFSLKAVDFSAAVLSAGKIKGSIKEHLKIIEELPASKTYVEECFYHIMVMKR